MNAGESLFRVGLPDRESTPRPDWEWPIPRGWASLDSYPSRWTNSTPHKRGVFLSLYRRDSIYCGPAEGGQYATDMELIEYWEFPDKESAEAAMKSLADHVKERSKEGKDAWCRQMAAECDKAEAMGVEPDYFGEPNGPSDYRAYVETSLGESEYQGSRTYE